MARSSTLRNWKENGKGCVGDPDSDVDLDDDESGSKVYESDFDDESESDTDEHEGEHSEYDDDDKAKKKKQPSEAEKKIIDQKASLKSAWNTIVTTLMQAQGLSKYDIPNFPTGNWGSDLMTLIDAHNSSDGEGGVLVDFSDLVISLVDLDLAVGGVIEGFQEAEQDRKSKATNRARLTTAHQEAYFTVARSYIENVDDLDAEVEERLSNRDHPAGSRAHVKRAIKFHIAEDIIKGLEDDELTAALVEIEEKTQEIFSEPNTRGRSQGGEVKDLDTKLEEQRFKNAHLFAKKNIIEDLMDEHDREDMKDDVKKELRARCSAKSSKSKKYNLKKVIKDEHLQRVLNRFAQRERNKALERIESLAKKTHNEREAKRAERMERSEEKESDQADEVTEEEQVVEEVVQPAQKKQVQKRSMAVRDQKEVPAPKVGEKRKRGPAKASFLPDVGRVTRSMTQAASSSSAAYACI